jgi:hypothetical protein
MTSKIAFSDNEQTTILLAEYATLRAEIIQRSSSEYQIYTVSGTIFVAIVGTSLAIHSASTCIGLTAILSALVTVALRFIDYSTRQTAARLQELEQTINGLAGRELLVWESRHGLLAVGYGPRWRQVLGIG